MCYHHAFQSVHELMYLFRNIGHNQNTQREIIMTFEYAKRARTESQTQIDIFKQDMWSHGRV